MTWLRAIAAWLAITVPILGAVAWMLSQHEAAGHPEQVRRLREELHELRLEIRDELRALRGVRKESPK